MESSSIILVAIGSFFGGVAGLLLGLAVSFFRGRNSQNTKQDSPPEAESTSSSARLTPKDSVELLSVWRNERTHKLLALLDNKPLSPSQLTEEQKERLSHILSGLHALTGDLTQSTPATPAPRLKSEETPEAPAEELPHPQGEGEELHPEEGLTPRAKKVYFADTLPEPVSLRQALASNPFKINVPSSSQKPSSAPKTIVEQIDEILQMKLVDSPYAEHEISLKEVPNGMMVIIGDYEYEGIDAVPEPAIRALIKEAAREWNEKVSRKRG